VYYLPDSVGCLKQLETLDIKYTGILKLPKTIIKLTNLCYLKAGNEFFVGEEQLILSCCAPLACCTTGPVRAYAVKVPVGIGKLKSLHTLRSVHLEWENVVIEEIKCLTSLRKLGVFGIDRGNSMEFCWALSGLCSLESLSVHSSERDLYDCLQGIVVSPPEKLRTLKLHGWLRKLPKWIMVLQNLVKIKLEYTEVSGNVRAMQALGNLPNLSILRLKESAFQNEGPITFQSGLFRSLLVLELVYLEVEVESLVFEETSMPKLEVLSLRLADCKTGFSGLEFLPSIKEVQLCVLVNPMLFAMEESMTEEEAEMEAERREDKVKEDIRNQLISNKNSPILKVQLTI
jgi:Leucine-rich repeat (LRR) protein